MNRLRKITKSFAIILILIVFFYFAFLHSFLLHWGATDPELKRVYPGDSVVLSPDYINTLAVTIQKPPREIWPWVAQMGLNKGGFYTYTWLENLLGCKLHNAYSINSEWQNPRVGDYEPVCAEAVKRNMPGWTIHIVPAGKSFVYKMSPDSSWTMGFYIDSVNENTSLLITRMRYVSPKGILARLGEKLIYEWVHCIMQKGSINGIRKRAERERKPGT